LQSVWQEVEYRLYVAENMAGNIHTYIPTYIRSAGSFYFLPVLCSLTFIISSCLLSSHYFLDLCFVHSFDTALDLKSVTCAAR
jgi:hypothetical protein